MNKVECPECTGTGQHLVPRMYPSGYTECWEDCPYCDGLGEFDEDVFLVLKLEGYFVRDLYNF